MAISTANTSAMFYTAISTANTSAMFYTAISSALYASAYTSTATSVTTSNTTYASLCQCYQCQRSRAATPKERAYLEAQRAEAEARLKAEQRKWETAKRRSMRLLCRHLSPSQKKEWRRHRRFTVIGSKGGRYVVSGNLESYNVKLATDPVWFCATLPGLPKGDILLAQKLAIETDETGFRRRANRM